MRWRIVEWVGIGAGATCVLADTFGWPRVMAAGAAVCIPAGLAAAVRAFFGRGERP